MGFTGPPPRQLSSQHRPPGQRGIHGRGRGVGLQGARLGMMGVVGVVGTVGVASAGLMDGAAGSLSPHGRLGSGLEGSPPCVMPVPAVCRALFVYLQPIGATQADQGVNLPHLPPRDTGNPVCNTVEGKGDY